MEKKTEKLPSFALNNWKRDVIQSLTVWSGFRLFLGSVITVLSCASVSADQTTVTSTIDDLGFNGVINTQLFKQPGFKIDSKSTISLSESKGQESQSISGLIEIEKIKEAQDGVIDLLGTDEIDYTAKIPHVSDENQGFRIKRLSAGWKGEGGTLTVGNDWANFQDFLGDNALPSGVMSTDLVRWSNPNGFSISLENMEDSKVAIGGDEFALIPSSNPGVVLTWENGSPESAQYRVSALGRSLDVDGYQDNKDLGWGLNLEGGWRFGELFTALSVTIGKGINSLVFKDAGSDATLESDGSLNWVESIAIKPSLKYSLSDRSNVHLSLGRYMSKDEQFGRDVDTLDTIHLGYTWSPWQSTHFGVEVVGKEIDRLGGSDEVSTQVKIGALKQF